MSKSYPGFPEGAFTTDDPASLRLKVKTDLPIEESSDGSIGLSVYTQDQTTDLLPVPLLQQLNETTLAVDAVQDERTVTLAAGHGAVIGNVLELAETGTTDYMQSGILNVAGDVITLDCPIPRPFTVAGTIVLVSTKEMLVDGSVTPQIFSILPLPTQSGDMVRIIIEIRGTGAMDFSTFGSDPALVNGCVLRVKRADGTFKNLFNFKSNGDFIQQAYDHDFFANVANNVRGFSSRLTWGGQSKQGVVIRLDGSKGEELQLVVQDALNGGDNTRFHINAQGHELQ